MDGGDCRKSVHKSVSTNIICRFIQMEEEKTFKTLHCQMCGIYLKEIKESQKNCKIKISDFLTKSKTSKELHCRQ